MLNIVVCDDSIEFSEIISYKISQCIHNQFEINCKIVKFYNLFHLKKYIEHNKVDILFLDVMINDENAMDWSIENIKSSYTHIIFMTSFPEYAYNISESNCCYYLVKSKINNELLSKALKRALHNNAKKDPNMTILKQGAKNFTINYSDVLYIETFNNSISFYFNNNENIIIYATLKEYEDKVPPNFLRCHKCYMINMNYVVSYEPYKFTLNSDIQIPIPPKKYKETIKNYQNYLLKI